ncbi:MAG: hypothetical protein IPG56_14805 [Caulobacteraceae bacterium]|nr:hypothetical protein [Caulobacteraceae bacterium]
MKGKPLVAGLGAHDEIVHLAARANEPGVVEVWPLTPKPVIADAEPWDAPMDMERESSAHVVLAKRIAKHVKAMIEAREAVWDKGALAAHARRRCAGAGPQTRRDVP